MDKDTLAIDDSLGEALVEWKDCFQNPSNFFPKTIWMICVILKYSDVANQWVFRAQGWNEDGIKFRETLCASEIFKGFWFGYCGR